MWPLSHLGESTKTDPSETGDQPSHAAWLGASQESDARETASIVEQTLPHWVVVDHYALDASWERHMRSSARRVLVVDDLADRPHECDLLVDQNLGRDPLAYQGKVGMATQVLAGPRYALLRPEFRLLREREPTSKQSAMLRNIVVAMGGVDQHNASGKVLSALNQSRLDRGCRITIVMGSRSPALAAVWEAARRSPFVTDVCVDVTNMAERMACADLAIGAAGGSAWERCCLGLPSLVVVLAENQRSGALALAQVGAARLIGDIGDIEAQVPLAVNALLEGSGLEDMAAQARAVTDGQGVDRIVSTIEAFHA